MSLINDDELDGHSNYDTLHFDQDALGNDDGYGYDLDEDDLSFDFEDPNEDEEFPPPPSYYPNTSLCIVCEERPAYSKGGKSYPTCGLRCAGILENAKNNAAPSTSRAGVASGSASAPVNRRAASSYSASNSPTKEYPAPRPVQAFNVQDLAHQMNGLSFRRSRNPGSQTSSTTASASPRASRNINSNTTTVTSRPPVVNLPTCVVCVTKPCRDSKYVTCGLTCAEKLCKSGSSNPNMCDYCHRRPKAAGFNQCGAQCRDSAKLACLLCKARPKLKRYHLCGRTCKSIATKSTPLILEAPPGHITYELVEQKFKSAWKYPATPTPTIKKIYKIIENKNFLLPYDRYKKTVGNEVFRYHGTTRKCTLGSPGNTQLCASTGCALCSILRTSFKTSLANPSGAFGPGIYTSSAANKAFSYTGNSGAIILTKVVLGTPRMVNGWNEVMSCPPGFNSVVFDRQGGSLNETIVYSDDAIRPVFLIIL